MNTIEVKQTTIFLQPTDAEAFKLFMQYYDNFNFLLKHGAFNIQQGEVTFNRNEKGIIQDVIVANRFKR